MLVGNLEADLATFYDQQAPRRAALRADPARELQLDDFVELLRSEGRRSLFEVGTGPGRDAAPFMARGLRVSGIDLSAENVRYCAERGIDCRQASLFAIPFEDDAFEAGWTMSTLLHVPNDRIDDALTEITRVLEPGAPLAIGVWGGADTEAVNEDDRIEPKRFFSRRSDQRWRAILERHGDIERFETWPERNADGNYQYCVLRTPAN